ncbi:hypothetical protein CUC15_10260 [Oceanobacillus zhaokaii]|uniref:Uncharacterized protein n=1 Tax=Oceanobacillus zhaokaii TaxID=2052660 RepID=A0A345PH04_9BACI|nr:hypothetical protein [Oceanobacillus zhaokaii]AXI09284.1 hypothetical protein CUC15_10260 [Oceanobacillus zhaokaii]
MFNWFRKKKKQENRKQTKSNYNSTDNAAIIPGVVASGLDDDGHKHSHDYSSNSHSSRSDYSSGSSFDSGGSDSGGGDF